MNNVLPLSVSSKSVDVTINGEPIKLNPFANAGITAADAPVLLSLGSKGTVDADGIAARIPKAGGHGTRAEARLLLNSFAEVIDDLVEEYGAITVQTPFGTIQTFIAGTVDHPQDQPDPTVNYAFLGVVVPEAYRKAFAEIETYVPADACPVSLKRVRDKATDASGICGTQPFCLEGRGMSFGGEGETLELLDAVTRDKLCDIAVDAESKSQAYFLCTLSPQTAIEAGKYLLRLTTLAGGEPGATLWPVELKVELLEAVPAPGPVPLVKSSDGFVKVMSIDEDPVPALDSFTVRGENVGYRAGIPDHGLMGAEATVAGKPVSWHCTENVDEHASAATFESDGSEDPPEPGEYTAALTLNYAVADDSGESHLEPLVIENVRFTVGE